MLLLAASRGVAVVSRSGYLREVCRVYPSSVIIAFCSEVWVCGGRVAVVVGRHADMCVGTTGVVVVGDCIGCGVGGGGAVNIWGFDRCGLLCGCWSCQLAVSAVRIRS